MDSINENKKNLCNAEVTVTEVSDTAIMATIQAKLLMLPILSAPSKAGKYKAGSALLNTKDPMKFCWSQWTYFFADPTESGAPVVTTLKHLAVDLHFFQQK